MNGDLFMGMPEKQTAAFPLPHAFQAAAHQKLREGFTAGHRKQLLVAPTGAGKTFCALRIVRETLLKGHRAVFVCDRTALINQTSAVADSYGLDEHGIIQADHWRRNNALPFQIASVQTLQARGYWPEADVYILDECFPASTKILMQDGSSRPIEQVNSGDQILSAIGPDVVESVFCKSAAALVRVRLSDGTEFSCTPDHPVFTDIGWTAAGKLEKRQRLFGVQALRALWEGVQAKTDALAAQSSGSRVSVLDPQILREILLMECAQPDEVGAIHPQDARDACAHRASAEDAGWQRQATTADTAEDAGRSRRRMGDGIYRADAHGAPQWLSYALQDRSGAQGFANRIGARWLQSLRAIETSTGRTEGRVTPQVRVESVALEECRGGTLVYNLRVRRHPSYFANGILVHNCHTLYSTTRELLSREHATVIGLTATPCTKGLGLLYSNMINAATMHELTQSGVLVPMDILTCVKPDMTGAKTAGGEWTAKAAGEREAQIIGDVVGEWQRHGENRKTIAFGADIAYCTALVQRFNAAGINAAMYTAETPDHERTALLAEFEKPDPAIRILVSVEALAKGFDCFDSETEILTPHGWRGCGQFAAGDAVYGFNRETETLEIVEVEGYGERAVKDGEQMVAIKSQRFDIRTTEGHEFHVKYRDPKKNYLHKSWQTKTAREMVERKSAYAIPIAAEYDFPGVRLSDDELRLIAWFMTDGSLHRMTFSICQSKPFKLEIRELLKRLELDFREYEKKPGLTNYPNSKPAAIFDIPKGTHKGSMRRRGWAKYAQFLNKNVSPALMTMTRKQFGVFWAELLKGDGATQSKKSGWLWCDRKEQADAYTHLAVTRGFAASFSLQKTKTGKTMYVVSVRDTQLLGTNPKSPIGAKFKFEDPRPGEIVWCLKNRLSTVITRRRGKIAIVGNCPDIGCVIDARPLRKSLSTAIQMWGRGLRASKETGKENCRLLDFSGNIQRFYDDFTAVYFNGFSHLSDAEKQDAKPREEADFTPTGCPQCQHKPFRRRCLACGFEKPTQALEDTAAGEMREIKIGKVTAASSEQDMWAQLCTYARQTSAKAPGRAWHLYQDIVGKKPTGLTRFDETPDVEVHPATLRKIKSLRIAWIKGTQK